MHGLKNPPVNCLHLPHCRIGTSRVKNLASKIKSWTVRWLKEKLLGMPLSISFFTSRFFYAKIQKLKKEIIFKYFAA